MNHLLTQRKTLKAEIKALRKELLDELMQDAQFEEFIEDLKASREVLSSYRKKRIEETPKLGSLEKKIKNKKTELKVVVSAIFNSVTVVDKESGEQLSLNLLF